MNNPSEQLTADKSLHIALDQPLTPKQMQECLVTCLGTDICCIQEVQGRKVAVVQAGDKPIILLTKAVTYLGNPHPAYKKRVQLPTWFKEFCLDPYIMFKYDVRFVGVYHYDGNVVFVEWNKDTYLQKKSHNSSAHIYTNDLFQGMTYGVFRKRDQFGNTVVAIRYNKFRQYITGQEIHTDNLFDLFAKFNFGMPFGKWLYCYDAIKEMYEGKWPHFEQAEWAGFFLEYRFNKFIIDEGCERKMRYISQKSPGDLDFDIRFEDDDFYGDLKASDITHKDAPGNKQENIIECLQRYDRFWYVIYEHETVKEKEREKLMLDRSAAYDRWKFLHEVDPRYDKDVDSYITRLKHSVRFQKMSIVELNRINYRDILKPFNQGHQPDGKPRLPKFNINKNILNNDNFVVFRYDSYQDIL